MNIHKSHFGVHHFTGDPCPANSPEILCSHPSDLSAEAFHKIMPPEVMSTLD